MTSQNLMREYAFHQLCFVGLDEDQAKLSSRSCVSQRDIQRVFTFYQWVMDSYTKHHPYGARPDYSRRAVLVALGIVYYMRLITECLQMLGSGRCTNGTCTFRITMCSNITLVK